MTLGGLTIAIGALVDDAIIDVENVFRRLRLEHRSRPKRAPRPRSRWSSARRPRCAGPSSSRPSIIALVFLPLFLLPGMEGRLLRPLGLAYIASLAARCWCPSPSRRSSAPAAAAVAALLESRRAVAAAPAQGALRRDARRCAGTIRGVSRRRGRRCSRGRSPRAVPRPQLPAALQRGKLTVAVVSPPASRCDESDAIGREVEKSLLAFPEVVSTSRRTGRAEKDEHVQGVNASEMEVVLRPGPPQGPAAGRDAPGGGDDPGGRGELRPAHQPPHRPHDLGQQDRTWR